MPRYEVNAPDGQRFEVDAPEGATLEDAFAYVQSNLWTPLDVQAKKKRTWGEAAADIGGSLTKGVGQLAQIPGQVAGLVTGNVDPTTGLQGLGGRLEQYGEELKSPTLKARQQLAGQKMAQAEGLLNEFGTAIKTYATDPMLATAFVAEQLPNLFGAGAGGIATKAAVKTAMVGASKEALEKTLPKAAVRGAVGTGAVMQGADIGTDTFDTVLKGLIAQGMPEQEAYAVALQKGRVAAIEAAGISVGTAFLPGGTAIERAMVGKGLPGTGGFLRGAAGEALSEGIEEGGGAFVKNIGVSEALPGTSLTKGVGTAAGLGALGGALFGGPAGAVSGMREADRLNAIQAVKDQQQQIVDAENEAAASADQARRDAYAAEQKALEMRIMRERLGDQFTQSQAFADLSAQVEAAKEKAAASQAKAQAKIQAIQAKADVGYAEQSEFPKAQPDLFGMVYPQAEQEIATAQQATQEQQAQAQGQMELPLEDQASLGFNAPEQPTRLPEEKQELAPTGRPVTEADFKAMGINKSNKKLREAILGKDLSDPAQAQEVKDVLENYAGGNRSEPIIQGVTKFIDGIKTPEEQLTLGLRRPYGSMKKPVPPTKAPVEEVLPDVEQPIEPVAGVDESSIPEPRIRRKVTPSPAVTGVAGRGVVPTGGVAGAPVDGEGNVPSALEPTAEEDFATQKRLIAKVNRARKEVARAEAGEESRKAKAKLEKADAEYEAFEAEARPRADARIAKLTGQTPVVKTPKAKPKKAPLSINPFGQLVEAVAPKDKADLTEEEMAGPKRDKTQYGMASDAAETQALLDRLLSGVDTSEVTPEELTGKAKKPKESATGEITGTKLQQNAEFAKRMGYVSSVGGHRLKGAINKKMMAAAEAGDIKGVLDALSKSKSPVYRKIAEIAKTVKGLKVAVDGTKIEKIFSNFKQGIDIAKVTIANIDALREAKRRVDAGMSVSEAAEGIIQYPKGLTPDVKFDQTLASTLFSDKVLFDKDAFYKYVAEQEAMLEGNEEGTRYAAGTPVEIEAIPGLYDPATNTIYLDPYFGKYEDLLAHELTHAISHDFISSPKAKNTPAYKALDKLYQHVLTEFSDKDAYGLSSLDEFVSEGLSNPLFQKELSNIKYENTTAWNKFVQGIAKILGLKPDNAFTELLNLTTTEAEKGQSTKRGGRNLFSMLPDAVKKWFGDSVAVDENGEPLVLYHGTKQGFDQFKLSKEGALGSGIYLTPNAEFASSYAGNEYEGVEGGRVLPVIAYISNPLIIRTTDRRFDPAVDLLVALGVSQEKAEKIVEKAQEDKGGITKEAMVRAQKQGYDGIFQYKDGKLSEVVAFSPNQVKSIFNKNPLTSGPKFSLVASLEDIDKRAGYSNVKPDPKQGVFKTLKSTDKKQIESGVKKFLNKAETMYFSSDAALQNAIRKSMEEGGMNWEDQKRMMFMNSTSQALHPDAVAMQLLQEGGVDYEPDTYKWKAVKKENSWQGLIKDISVLAKKYNVSTEQMSNYAHRAFIADRLKGLTGSKEDFFSHKTPAEIEAGLEYFKAIPELRQLQESWNKVRKNAMDAAVIGGLYSESQAKELLDIMDYVPFIRVEQINAGAGPKEYGRGLLDFAKGYKIRGSEDEVNNIFDNMERWVSYTVSRAVKNRTALNLKDAAQQFLPEGEVTELRQDERVKREQNTIDIWENGQRKKYEFKDPLFVYAFQGTEPVTMPVLKAMSAVSNILRKNIVLNPLFSVSQLSQDSVGAMFTSGLKNPFAIPFEVAKEFTNTLRGKSAAHAELAKYGAAGVRDYSAAVARNDAEVMAGLASPTKFQKILSPFEKFAMASDNAVRQAVYNLTLKETKSAENPNGDKAVAIEKAFEIINFKRSGASGSVQVLKQVVPFFGAYLQAQNVAYKTIMGKGIAPVQKAEAQRTLLSTSAKIAALGFIYAALAADDEDYQKMDPTIRDRHLLIPGTGFMLPLRPDVFILPKLAAEYAYQAITDQGFTDGKKMRRGMADAVMNAILSPTVVPQVAKPALEVMTNYNFFTGRPLVGMGLENKITSEQFTNTTSELAKFLGKAGLIAPVNIDHLIKGYLGTTGGLALQATSSAANIGSATPAPAKSFQDTLASTPGLSTFFIRENGAAMKNDYYELRGEVDKAVATYNNMLKTGRIEDAKEFYQDKKDLFAVKQQVNTIERQLTKLRDRTKVIYASTKMSSEEKGAELKRIKETENRMLANINDLRRRAGY